MTYHPKQALHAEFPEMKDFSDGIDKDVERIAEDLSKREWRGQDTSYARARLLELRWRTNATGDVGAARQAFERLGVAIAEPNPPSASVQDELGSFAPGTDVWFLKLDRSTDQLLAREWPWRIAPYFLESIDDPIRLYTYLEDLSWCDIKCRGVDTRKELNLAVSVIARLALRGGQAGYLASPGIIPALESFVRDWRDPDSGFFGVKYIIDDQGHEFMTKDLSLTFHMVRYLPHLVQDWRKLIDTLLDVSETEYPQGRVNPDPQSKTNPDVTRYSNHNNYDVAEILRRGWRHMEPSQRVRASELIGTMLDWCLGVSVKRNGEVVEPDTGDMVPDAYYFGAAFLDTVGYFDRTKRFWTEKDIVKDKDIRAGMASRLLRFNPRLTVVADASERLDSGHQRPTSNAVL